MTKPPDDKVQRLGDPPAEGWVGHWHTIAPPPPPFTGIGPARGGIIYPPSAIPPETMEAIRRLVACDHYRDGTDEDRNGKPYWDHVATPNGNIYTAGDLLDYILNGPPVFDTIHAESIRVEPVAHAAWGEVFTSVDPATTAGTIDDDYTRQP